MDFGTRKNCRHGWSRVKDNTAHITKLKESTELATTTGQ